MSHNENHTTVPTDPEASTAWAAETEMVDAPAALDPEGAQAEPSAALEDPQIHGADMAAPLQPQPQPIAPPAAHTARAWLASLVASVLALLIVAAWGWHTTQQPVARFQAAGHALVEAQRLGRLSSAAMQGQDDAFAPLAASTEALKALLPALQGEGSADIAEPVALQAQLDRTVTNAATIGSHHAALVAASTGLEAVHSQAQNLAVQADALVVLQLQQGVSPAEVAAASRLAVLSQRMGYDVQSLLSLDRFTPDTIDWLGQDLDSFDVLLRGLTSNGREGLVRPQLQVLRQAYDALREQAEQVMPHMNHWLVAHAAHDVLQQDLLPVRTQLEAAHRQSSQAAPVSRAPLVGLLLAGLWVLVSVCGVVRRAGAMAPPAVDKVPPAQEADMPAAVTTTDAAPTMSALVQEDDVVATQVAAIDTLEDPQQAAILRLMDELQQVAEGDLTHRATVTEDITGALADAVNYTVDELSSLVRGVQDTTAQVVATSIAVEAEADALQATTQTQLQDIRSTGEGMLAMAERITAISAQAQNAASVAQQSLQVAAQGQQAVDNAIDGMQTLREQMQDTSKRIKRLGESSQEIGDITELIADITEQTHVLALNAAIQAASAGEAGRGFAMVAQEVQRLAERSADATRQIALLVQAIQSDTHDGMAAMERSTQRVVQGAALTDSAGTALQAIDQVAQELAQLVAHMATTTGQEAERASEVATTVQHIFAVTQDTAQRTQASVAQVHTLRDAAKTLRQSVARFKID